MQWGHMQNFLNNVFRYPTLKLEIGIWFLDIRQSIDIHFFLDLMMSNSGLLMDRTISMLLVKF